MMDDFSDEDSVNNILEGMYELKNGRVRLLSDVEKAFGVDYGDTDSVTYWTKERKLSPGTLLKPRQILISSESERYMESTGLETSIPTVSIPAITTLCKSLREASFKTEKSEHTPSRIHEAYEIMNTGTCYAVVYTLDRFGENQMEVLCLAPLELWKRQPELVLDFDSI